jgi:hypothetical protein
VNGINKKTLLPGAKAYPSSHHQINRNCEKTSSNSDELIFSLQTQLYNKSSQNNGIGRITSN